MLIIFETRFCAQSRQWPCEFRYVLMDFDETMHHSVATSERASAHISTGSASDHISTGSANDRASTYAGVRAKIREATRRHWNTVCWGPTLNATPACGPGRWRSRY